jgi:hypothetical protein
MLTVGVSLLSVLFHLPHVQSITYFSTDPADYDFSGTRAITTLEDTNKIDISSGHVSDRPSDTESQKETKVTSEKSSLKRPVSDAIKVGLEADEEQRIRSLKRVFRKALIYSSILTLIVIIIGEFRRTIQLFYD